MKRILIVEDELSIAELQRDYLEMAGFKADIETSGDRGLRQARTGEYDLILLDIMLPVVDGLEICKQLRAELNIPILLVSAKNEDLDKIRGLGFGADDYITKPFSPSELVARVRAHTARFDRLTGHKEQMSETIQIRGLRIDKGARRVFVNAKEVGLTAKEFDLLYYMALNPDRVFSKSDLFERIWGMDSMGDIATVTVHIGKIRDKIEADTSNPQYIETIWGAGYRLKA
ncbi:response regulator transcription factor [Gorillibacterium sp. sgz5001074]|uniref:response regulator transcription factor n=1 Tax=Gorillibacterium sp. sgz5001074 TaxID=3446695 RepID=UPI003F676941